MTEEIFASVEEQWKDRAKSMQLKTDTDEYRKAEGEFFIGAMAAFVAFARHTIFDLEKMTLKEKEGKAMNPRWIFSIQRGDSIIDKLK